MKTTYLIFSLFFMMPLNSFAYKPSKEVPRRVLYVDTAGGNAMAIPREYQNGFPQPARDNQPHDLVVPVPPDILNIIDEARDIDHQLDRIVRSIPSLCSVLCPAMTGIGIILLIRELIS